MNDPLTEKVSCFLKRQGNKKKLLLGFSGGPDSLALLHVLLSLRRLFSFELALAHVDHGWRRESKEEAVQISALAAALSLPLHLETLALGRVDKNLEEVCREARLDFFASLCRSNGYEALLLAHHADDHAETVFKRIVEGAALPHLCGMTPVSTLKGMSVWRPFLEATKQEILAWLTARGLQGFHDTTNDDPKFLRCRLRNMLFPYLSEVFGKDIRPGLCHLGGESADVLHYLDSKVVPLLAAVSSGPFGSYMDCSESVHAVELQHLLRRFFEGEGLFFSREMLAEGVRLLLAGAANKRLGSSIAIDRHHLFAFTGRPLCLDAWHVVMEETDALLPTTDWRSLWRGAVSAALPLGSYRIAAPDSRLPYGSTTLAAWWTQHKVPAFFRNSVPILVDEKGGVQHEFLTGRQKEASGRMKGVRLVVQIKSF